MNRWTRHAPGLLFAALALAPAFASALWGRAEEAAPADGPTLTLTSPHRRELRYEFTRAFREHQRARTGKDVNLVWLDVGGGTSAILKDLRTRFEKTPNHIGVDLLFGGGIDPYVSAAREGWLAPGGVPASALEGIPPTLLGLPVYDETAGWYGVALSGFGIIYHKGLLARLGLPEPRAWADLADPGYFSWVANVDPGQSGAAHMCFEIVLQSQGWDAGWSVLTRMAGNSRVFGDRASVAPNEVCAGDAAAGMAIDQYAQTAIQNAGNPDLAFILPAGQTLVNADSIAILKNGPEPELARAFVAFALSPEGQRLLATPPGVNGQRFALRRNPVRPALYAELDTGAGNPFEFSTDFAYDGKRAGRRWDVVNLLVNSYFIETQRDLIRAWRAVIDRGLRPDEVARLGAAPLPEAEAEAERLAAEASADPARRMELRRAWAVDARARYRSLW